MQFWCYQPSLAGALCEQTVLPSCWGAGIVETHSRSSSEHLDPWEFCSLKCDSRTGMPGSRFCTVSVLSAFYPSHSGTSFWGQSYSCIMVVQMCRKIIITSISCDVCAFVILQRLILEKKKEKKRKSTQTSLNPGSALGSMKLVRA